VGGFGRGKHVAVQIVFVFGSTMAATAGFVVMQTHPRSPGCSRAGAIEQRRTERAFRDLGDGRLRQSKPSLIDQKENGIGRNVHKTICADAIAPNAVIGLVLAKRGTKRYQLRHDA
jgi:hypothetical protein